MASKQKAWTLLAFGSIISGCLIGCTRSVPKYPDWLLGVVKEHGWSDDFKRGGEMQCFLSTLSTGKKKKFDDTAFQGQNVAFFGYGAPPGASNDLLTAEGFYLRILNKDSKDFRPRAVAWSALVRGKVCNVLPENNIIIIHVGEKDWILLDVE